ncbi:hypothetical protein [Acinetobacter ursingii]|uniref:hypothetical protein n=1 Tax=Acinetobacter ursingii TaxID=108980 RepID=UPI00292A577C|nr:hypothetical protein [Acinetobacter ursingii]
MTFTFAAYLYRDYKETGGYRDDSDGYFGYLFPSNNGFTKVEDCNPVITEFPEVPPPSQEWWRDAKNILICIKTFSAFRKSVEAVLLLIALKP